MEHARALSLRQGEYKMIEANPGPAIQVNTNTETGANSSTQLYNVKLDIAEQKNLAGEMPGKVAEMTEMLARVKAGR